MKHEDQKNARSKGHAVEATAQSSAAHDQDEHGRSKASHGGHEKTEIDSYAQHLMFWLCKRLCHRKHLRLTASLGGVTFTGKHMSTQLTDAQKFTLTVVEQNTQGGVVPFVGVPVWEAGDGSVVTLLVSPDSTSAVVSSVAVGLVNVSVVVDNLRAEYSVEVIASPGVQLVFTATAPEPK